MKHKVLKHAAALALSRVDKESASQVAASVAAAVARRDGHPGVRMIASLVAQGLNAPVRPNDTAPHTPLPEGEGDTGGTGFRAVAHMLLGNQTGRDAMATAGRAVESMASAKRRPLLLQASRALSLLSPATEPPGNDLASPAPAQGAPLDVVELDEDEPFMSPAGPAVGRPDDSPEEVNQILAMGQIRGPLDAINCGAYQLSLFQHQLIVAGPQRGTFDLDGIPEGAEALLYTASGAATSVVLRRENQSAFAVCIRAKPPLGLEPLQATN